MAEAALNNVEYVRKDVFDISMQRLEALMERNLARQEAIAQEMKADNEKLRSEVKTEISGLRNEMKEEIGGLRAEIRMVDERVNSVNARVDSVQTTVYWGFAIMGLILAFTTFTPVLLEFVKGLRRPSFTLADVEQRIDAAIAKALKPAALS